MHATKHDLASNKMTSTGFDYFGVCDVVFPSLPTALTIPAAPAAPAPPPPHIPGTDRIYKETESFEGKEYICVYRSDEKTGHVSRTKYNGTKVFFDADGAFHNSYSNPRNISPIELMPVGYIDTH